MQLNLRHQETFIFIVHELNTPNERQRLSDMKTHGGYKIHGVCVCVVKVCFKYMKNYRIGSQDATKENNAALVTWDRVNPNARSFSGENETLSITCFSGKPSQPQRAFL